MMEKSSNSVKRVQWLDVAKFFGIFAIYLGHFADAAGWGHYFVFAFHVPLFFFISGCTEALNQDGILVSLYKKIKNIFIPYVVFAIAVIIVHTINTNAAQDTVKEYLLSAVQGAIRLQFFAGSLWFLTCLFVVSIVFTLIKKMKYKILILGVSLFFYTIAETYFNGDPMGIFNVDSAMYYLIYYALGYLLFEKIDLLLSHKGFFSRSVLILGGV
ncbi:MAG: acyltransferase family protein [Lachnospiraceae bacterium]|nr:acyltransferase family protein [Lachnospiraceae bacterium]